MGALVSLARTVDQVTCPPPCAHCCLGHVTSSCPSPPPTLSPARQYATVLAPLSLARTVDQVTCPCVSLSLRATASPTLNRIGEASAVLCEGSVLTETETDTDTDTQTQTQRPARCCVKACAGSTTHHRPKPCCR
eukprot:2207002-Rhodomonas_salina.1